MKPFLQKEDSIKVEIRSSMASGKNDSYQKSINKLLSNINLYKDIKAGTNWTLASKNNNIIEWLPLISFLTEEKVIAQKI